jgi:ATP-dependent RNA helicase DeaD
MAKVKKGEVRFMVATDIAARGIDISDLSHVVNYSLPEDPSVFLHRVGRTGRIGKKGTSLSLVSGAEIMTLSALQKKFGIAFEERQLPTPEEARSRWTERHVAELKEAMSASIFEAYIPLAQQLRGRPDGEYLTAFALKYFFTHHRIEKMTDLQKAEHKRQEHERKERQEAAGNKELARRERRDGPREGRDRERGPRRDRPERPERAARSRGDRPDRPSREPREARAASEEIPASIPTVEVPATLEESEERLVTPVHEVDAEREVSSGREGREGGGERESRAPSGGRIWLSWGEADGADEGRLRELVASRAPGAPVLAVEVRRSHAFLEVGPESIDAVVNGLNGAQVGDKAITAEKARRRRR